jgi:uncharacterized Zn finger protein (UPF0148 family)
MHGMTAPACPVCATPYEEGATVCTFCGVSLVEPEPKPAAKPRTRTKSAPKPATQPETRPDKPSSSPAPAEAVDPPTDASPPTPAAIDAPPVEASTAAPAEGTESGQTAEIPPELEPEPEPEPELQPEPELAAEAEFEAEPTAEAPHARTPSFATPPTTASIAQRRMHRIEWGVAAGLAALLLVQLVASDFDPLAASATTRPWLQRACAVLHCSLPPWREPRALRMLQRDVRAHPQRRGLLRISASFRNEARWTQAWPLLRVTLSDADGRTIAARDFVASEYLGVRDTANGIASGQVASVAFDVVDPSPRVTAFTFEFR